MGTLTQQSHQSTATPEETRSNDSKGCSNQERIVFSKPLKRKTRHQCQRLIFSDSLLVVFAPNPAISLL